MPASENKSPEANLVGRTNIVQQDDTPTTQVALPRTVADYLASAAHVAKMDAETTAREARAALSYMGASVGTIKRGR
jgi:hypothetical protein